MEHGTRAGIDLAGARVLAIAPHPDDESLALGGLIQHALGRGATVTVAHVTDGDNNPWPQRWLERRWRIGPADRRRWGERRVAEARQALRELGLDAADGRRFAWPDLGVGKRLARDGTAAVDAFVTLLRDVAPDVVVMPALCDRHPDHAASHVLLRLAMTKLPSHAVCLTYLVHGAANADSGATISIALDENMRANKCRAILAHGTQVALARRRLLRHSGPTECLRRLEPPERRADNVGSRITVVPLPWQPPRLLWPWLQLTVASADGVRGWRWRDAPVHIHAGAWQLHLSTPTRAPVFARLEMRVPSPWIFDHWGWCDLTATTPTGQAGV